MHQITSAQFRTAIGLDPAWASKLTEPTEITDHCDMSTSEVTHLSPLLHFTGKNRYGNSANFSYCEFLRIAEGKFKGRVNFSRSGIKKIRDLTCGKDNYGGSASFWQCEFLKIAEGKFEGYVSFRECGIEKIGDLSCGKNNDGIRLDIKNCHSLKSIPFTFNPDGIEAASELIKNLTEARAFIQKKREEIVEIEI